MIVIVVDQMRREMLARYGPHWHGGLRRLLDEGQVFERAQHAHATTYTAPGHASLATGTYPAKHGIAANDWWDAEGREVEAGDDPEARPLVEGGSAAGPAHLRREGLGDWLHAAYPKAQVWSLAVKDRAAVMMGGREPDGVLWWEVAAARHGSSSRYFEALPPWLVDFDAALDLEAIATRAWQLDPEDPPRASHEDDFEAEGPHRVFPHSMAEHAERGVGHWLRYQPEGDLITLDLATRLLDVETLGRDDTPDLLWIGLSNADYIGHRNGPHSQEVEMYFRAIDEGLGRFFDELDARELGPWIVLTSDHGVADIPQYAAREGRDARRFDPDPDLADLSARLAGSDACPDPELALIEDRGIRLRAPSLHDDARDRCLLAAAEALRALAWCEAAYIAPQFEGRLPAPNDPAFAWFARGYVPGRSPEISVRLQEGHLFERGYTSGTAHGSIYDYDTDVPLIISVPGLGAARHADPVALVDLAPTLAVALGLRVPPDLDGVPIRALLDAIGDPGWSKTPPER